MRHVLRARHLLLVKLSIIRCNIQLHSNVNFLTMHQVGKYVCMTI